MFDPKYNEPSKVNPYYERSLPIGHIGYETQVKYIWYSLAMLQGGEHELLADMPRLLGPGNYLNLGDARGGSSILLAQGLQQFGHEGKVYTIDLYVDLETSKYKKPKLIYKRCLETRLHYVEKGVDNLITQLVGPTEQWVEYFKAAEKTFRFVFIDADHSYEGVKGDFLQYSPLVEDDGLIAFHDTNQEWSDKVIRKYVEPGWERVAWINRIKVYKRCPTTT